MSLAYRTWGHEHWRWGDRRDWPEVDRLGQFLPTDIDWFAKFEERIYLVTKEDRVYVYGNQTNDQNVFGLDMPKGHNLTTPTEIVEFQKKKIVKFASSGLHMLALSADGQVWAWGRNEFAQLGDGTTTDHITPILVLKYYNVLDIVAVGGLSLVLTGSDEILAWGYNGNGECGIGNTDTLQPLHVKVLLNQVVVSLHTVYAGTSVARTPDSKLYVWGTGTKPSPTLVQVSSKAISVVTTNSRYYMLTEEGHIWRNIERDLGKVHVFYEGATKFKALYADHHSGGFLVAESVDGKWWMWTNAETDNTPVLIDAKDIVQVFAVHNHNGYVPFMVKLRDRTTLTPNTLVTTTPTPTTFVSTTPTPTTSVPATSTPSPSETCGHLCQFMERMFNNQTTSDTAFHLEGKTIYVDRNILVAASVYMSQQFAGAWKDKSSISIADYGYHVYYLYLHYLYTEQLGVTFDEAVALNVLATNLREDKLKERCYQIIRHGG